MRYRRNPLLMTVMGANPGRRLRTTGAKGVVTRPSRFGFKRSVFAACDDGRRICISCLGEYEGTLDKYGPATRHGECYHCGLRVESPSRNPVEGWGVTRDGETLRSGFASDFDAVAFLHKYQSQSADWAIRYGGFDIVLVKGGKVVYSYRREQQKRPQRNPSLVASMAGGMAGAIVTHALSNPGRSGAYDEDAARELELYVDNDGDLYRQQYIPIVKNLMLKRRKGIFDAGKAVKLFMYLMESGAKKYSREYADGRDWHQIFSKATREAVARRFVEHFITEADLGNWDHLLVRASKAGLRTVMRRGTLDDLQRDMEMYDLGHRLKLISHSGRMPPRYVRSKYDAAEVMRRYPGEQFTVIDLTAPPHPMENPLTTSEFMQITRDARALRNQAEEKKSPWVRGYYFGAADSALGVARRFVGPHTRRNPGRKRGRKSSVKRSRLTPVKVVQTTTTTKALMNPGGGRRKVTMSIQKFAELLRKKGDPKLWADFVKKVKGYQKWSHGTLPTKVTVERVDKPGVSGLWLTYDMGREPEKTYIMPKGTKRKGAWKHPWTKMPHLKGDPESGIIMTKLVSGNKLTNFLHG